MLFLPMVKMHTLVSHTILLNIETLVSQQSEFAFFGAWLRLRTFLFFTEK